MRQNLTNTENIIQVLNKSVNNDMVWNQLQNGKIMKRFGVRIRMREFHPSYFVIHCIKHIKSLMEEVQICFVLQQILLSISQRFSIKHYLFCEYKAFKLYFSMQVHGEYARGSKPPLGDQYLHFEPGSLLSSCSKTDKFKSRLFMPHHSLQVRNYCLI